jgi:predicted neutral ceramidase superfamily lipid hydrolase
MVLLKIVNAQSGTSDLDWWMQGFSQIIYMANPASSLILGGAILLAFHKKIILFAIGLSICFLGQFVILDNHLLAIMLANQLLLACFLASKHCSKSCLIRISVSSFFVTFFVFYFLYSLEMPIMVLPYIVGSMIGEYLLKKYERTY